MDSFLPILAVETSGDLCSVAVMMAENAFAELNYLQKHVHSEKLIGMIDSVLSEASLKANQLKVIAVSIGPGSFTGLRIGLSAAKGIAFGVKLPILPVPTDQAFALQIAQHFSNDTSFVIASNAGTEDVYYSRFVKRKNGIEIAEDLRLVEKSQLANLAANGEKIFGNIENENIIKLNYGVNAFSVARWAYLFGKDLLTFDYDYLEPNYFKKFVVKGKS